MSAPSALPINTPVAPLVSTSKPTSAKAAQRSVLQKIAYGVFRALHRLEVRGLENLPAAGTPTIIAPNHVSLLDAPLMLSILPGHATFAINTGIAEKPWVKPLLRLVRTLKIDPTRPLATRTLVQAVKGGETIVIFPEGRITLTGSLMKVYDGTAMIADRANALIVPVRIDGAERSRFSYLRQGQIKKALFPKIIVTIRPGLTLPVDAALVGRARRQAAGRALQDVMTDTAVATANLERTVFAAVADAAQHKSSAKVALQDALGTKLSAKRVITGAQVLGAKLEMAGPVGATVGVMLPNAVGGAVTLLALMGIGRVPAMINFTAGPANIRAACHAAQITTILTSRAFIEKGRLAPLIVELETALKFIYLEDVRATVTAKDKIAGLLAGMRPRVTRMADDPAVVLFTSGSEGVPKGVVLSHRNILANVAQCLARMDANGEDLVFNALPIFHALGLTGGLIMPLVGGIPVYLYPTPLHYRIIPELVYDSRATILFGTDTFLNGYARVAHPYDFRTLRMIVAGAEAVKDRTRQIYGERFGVRILEGYGVTETAPVLAVSTPMANKAGTVGRLSPLMEARLEDVPGVDGGKRLFVRGPNVMIGYLKADNPGVLERPMDGWHDTGDIVAIDAEGYIAIKGRAKRFAKIAGEMISLSLVEAITAEVSPAHVSCVVTLPDARKGERIVVLTPDSKAQRSDYSRAVKAKGLSDLHTPADILVVDKIPLLGSGKPDYPAATREAERLLTARIALAIERENAKETRI